MTTMIEIVCSVSKEEAAQASVEAFCKEIGGILIGRRLSEETHEILLIAQFLHTSSVNKHAITLSNALQQGVITSFRFVICDLVKISFDPSVDLREQMRDFPLRAGEWWFTSIHDPHQAYVCMNRSVMLAKQAAWLLMHEVEWAYV